MSEIAIKVENLSKSYRIRKGDAARYTALRDVMAERAGHFFNHLKKGQNPFSQTDQHETFWALDDVSFEVKQGEVMGVIGRNGAGKSTLLKILSRITEPDKGRITLNGRVASLLEVGTGFHPELTGRENIYLSGAILGMRRDEIKKRFDEIVDFAGVEKFLDTPVKRYSSGMYVRLGFAVAAHLETEILLVDEVLAVGDVEFQRKCMGKMGEVAEKGYAVLFVTHNLNLINRLCENSILLQVGTVKYRGASEEALAKYENLLEKPQTKPSCIREVQFLVNHKSSLICKNRDCVSIKVFFEFENPLLNPVLGIVLKNEFYQPVFGINNKHYNSFFEKEVKRGMMSIEIEELPALVTGYYTIDVHIGDSFGDRVTYQAAVQFYCESEHFEFGLQKKLNTILVKNVNWSIHEES